MSIRSLLINILRLVPLLLFVIFIVCLLNMKVQVSPTLIQSTEVPVGQQELLSISFSAPSGFYPEDFSLELSGPSGFTIHYTLDGGVPAEASLVYTEPITVTDVSDQPNRHAGRTDFTVMDGSFPRKPLEKALIIRAVGIDSYGVSTETVSATYFIGDRDYRESEKIISIIASPDDIFDPDTGLYVLGSAYASYVESGGDPYNDYLANYRQTGDRWERPAHIDFFDEHQNYIFSQETGIRINGSSSRSGTQKSLRLYARKKYDGNSRFTYPLFTEDIYPKSILLRRGEFANQFLPSLVYDRDLSTQKYYPCTVFLNGEYWGEYYLTERYSTEYMEDTYYVDEDNVTIVKDGDLFQGSSQIYQSYLNLLNYMDTADLSITKNYDDICSQIDIQSYIDYYCTQIYLNNYDFGLSKNMVLWRSNEADTQNAYANNRWRFALLDLDYTLTAYGDTENFKTNSFTDYSADALVVQTDEIMLRALMKSPEFRKQFVTTFLDLENVNFAYKNVCEKIDSSSNYIPYPDIWKEFFEKRPSYINAHLAKTFSLSGEPTEVVLEINDSDAGAIQLNTVIPNLTAGAWSGSYYSNYPVSVTALPKDGYTFKKWIVNGKSYETPYLSISLTDVAAHIYAVFEQL